MSEQIRVSPQQHWAYQELGELLEPGGLSYGVVQPGVDDPEGVPMLRVKNLQNGQLDTREVMRISKDIEQAHARTRIRGGEVLISLVGSVGEVAIAPPEIAGWNVARAIGVLRPRADVSSSWIQLCLMSATVKSYMRNWQNETVQATLNLRDVSRLPILMPPADVRRAVTELLGALDDKIAANNRSIVISTTLVSTLFDLALQDTGAVERNLNDVIEFDFGAPFSSTHFNESGLGFPLLRIRDLKTFKPRVFTSERLPRDILVAAGDVVVGMDAEFRPSLWFGTPALLNQRVLRGRHRGGESMAFVLEVLNRTLPQLERYKTGTTVIHLNKSDLDRASTVLPSPTATKTFSMSADPLIALVVSLRAENSNLEKLFNALLPKLMSREIQIKEGD